MRVAASDASYALASFGDYYTERDAHIAKLAEYCKDNYSEPKV